MADFSKQYCDRYDPNMPHDFDVLKEIENLENGQFYDMICEGFGFLAAGKDNNGNSMAGFDQNEKYFWLPLNAIDENTHRHVKDYARFVIIGCHAESDSYWVQETHDAVEAAYERLDHLPEIDNGLGHYIVYDGHEPKQINWAE